MADGTRAVTGNMCVDWGSCPPLAAFLEGLNMSLQLDVQGFSHVSDTTYKAYHARWPAKPLVGSECCSCETQRGEDNDIPYNTSLVYYSNFNADCVARETNWGLALPFVAGQFVWTAFDYSGEPDRWPHVSSSFGSYDLAGFPKGAVAWYRSWWLSNVSMGAADRPPIPSTAFTVHILEAWRPHPTSPNRTINVYSNAPTVSLSLNGAAPALFPMPAFGYARFTLPYAPGVLTAQALDASGAPVATATRASWGAPAALRLRVDSPSPSTGTGRALYLDGSDTALVRAEVVDAQGNVCGDAATRVAWSVTSGPGAIWGTSNGDPANQEPNHAPVRAAYNGLVRAVVRVTQASAVATQWGDGGAESVGLLAAVNVDGVVVPLPQGSTPPAIVVAATAQGLVGASVTIPTSVAWEDSVLAAAAANVARGVVEE